MTQREEEVKDNKGPYICHDLTKQLSYYLYFFSFLFFSFLDLLYIRSAEKCHIVTVT